MASEQDHIDGAHARGDIDWMTDALRECVAELQSARTRIAELERQQDAAGDYSHLADHVERVLLRCSSAGVEGVPDTHHDCGMTVMEANDLLAVMLQFSSRIAELEARAKRADVLEQAIGGDGWVASDWKLDPRIEMHGHNSTTIEHEGTLSDAIAAAEREAE